MILTDPNLHLLPWTRETGPDINATPATRYDASNEVGSGPSGHALWVTNYSAKDGGADLVTCKRPNYAALYPALNLRYVRLRSKMFLPLASRLNLGRLETDVKACMIVAPKTLAGQKPVQIRNVANASTQLNFSSGFEQIDGDPPGWKNTAFKPTPPSDVWFDYYHDLFIDSAAKTFTVLGMGFGAQTYKTASPDPQTVPWQNSNWQDLVAAIQLQIMVLKAGTITVGYDLMDLVWSDAAIA